ncbi:signal peptidase II [Paralimibaculum aggregatum]|uniref:Lipoprotein signal peptidase n=1 Tax=Paralimibaculum aggregatum TaxID=3036245 RepID=A0ABQ6LKM8_9RHOB|nr:signal peptidase II [Limibaculum sp. NKW23]GMG82222.1 signal peptidase II [Limibaculum sp. NKW23]
MTGARAAGAARRPVWRLIGVVALCVLLLDRLSKLWVLEVLDLQSVGRLEVAPPYLVFLMAWNPGVNFGLLGSADMRWVLVAVAAAISLALVLWAARRGTPALAAGAALVAGGALGNAWDRVQYGAVADFLNMSCCGIQNPFAFNIADVAIFLGAVVIAWKA